MQLWDVEFVLDAVLDTHRHQRVEAQLHERDLGGQILGCVAHGFGDDQRQTIFEGLRSFGIPLVTEGLDDLRQFLDVVGQPSRDGDHRGGKSLTGRDDTLEHERETALRAGVHLHRSTTRVRREGRGHRGCGGQLCMPDGCGQGDIGEHLRCSSDDELRGVGDRPRLHLPHVPAVGQRDVRTGDPTVATAAADTGVDPVRLSQERGTRNVGVVTLGKQTAQIHLVSVDVELRERGEHTERLVFLTLERLDEHAVLHTGVERGGSDRHQRGGIRVELDERRVTVGERLPDRLGEVHAVPHALRPVFDRVDAS